MKCLPQMSARDLSHVMYAYSVRGAGNPDFHTAMLKQIEPTISELDYPGLHNLVYYMMFRDNVDEGLWRKIVQTTIDQEDVLPLIYYKPFKASMVYLQHHFPQWDENRENFGSFLSDYQDKFFHSEKYFNVVKLDDEFHKEK